MQRILTDRKTITQTRIDHVDPVELGSGQVRLRLQSFALTANNVTYAATGEVLKYWDFFPSGVDGQGIVPVWGVARVVESRSDLMPLGAQYYGFYPMAEELVITPEAESPRSVLDCAPHRAELSAIYNRYTMVDDGPAETDHLRALFQPLLATSYLLFDWLADNDWFGAREIVIGSASSKTGLGLCTFLAEPARRTYRITGLTSEANRAFVEGLGVCDQVLSYDQIDRLAQAPTVYIDMSGNAAVKSALHHHLGDNVVHSAAVGTSHWDKFAPPQGLPGARPTFFFAPTQFAKRRAEWGAEEIEAEITKAWKRVVDQAAGWLDLKVHSGLAAVPAVYGDLAAGRASPRDGHVFEL